jgi:predicted adenylyl cyclase CyaB
MHLNVEIKARCNRPEAIRSLLETRNARYAGEDRQVDTYFNVPNGRLKLREGNLENALIHYHRTDQAGPKKSEVTLYKVEPGASLKDCLTRALGIWKVVDKRRHIYYIGNVKFHIDEVSGLGAFAEIEAIDETGDIGLQKLEAQCRDYMELFAISPGDLVEKSYSDLVEG